MLDLTLGERQSLAALLELAVREDLGKPGDITSNAIIPPNELGKAVLVARQEGVLAQEAKDTTVLLRLRDGGYYALEDVGALVWELCDGERTVADIVTAVIAEFDAPEPTVRADVLEFIGDMRREELLVVGTS